MYHVFKWLLILYQFSQQICSHWRKRTVEEISKEKESNWQRVWYRLYISIKSSKEHQMCAFVAQYMSPFSGTVLKVEKISSREEKKSESAPFLVWLIEPLASLGILQLNIWCHRIRQYSILPPSDAPTVGQYYWRPPQQMLKCQLYTKYFPSSTLSNTAPSLATVSSRRPQQSHSV